MVISNDKEVKKCFQIPAGGKQLYHQPALKILGNIITEDLLWDRHIRQIVIPDLANRVRTLRSKCQFMDLKFRTMYATTIFKGKFNFAIESWGGASKSLISKVQILQNRALKIILGRKAARLSDNQRHQMVNWLTVEQEINLGTLRMAHKVIHLNIPEELSVSMPQNRRNWIIKQAYKFDTKPKLLNKNKRTKGSFRNRAYLFNTLPHRLTQIPETKR